MFSKRSYYLCPDSIYFYVQDKSFIHPLEGYNKHEYCISLALGDLKATIGVRISLTTFLLTYFQVRTILKFKGWLLLDRTLLLGNQQLTSWCRVAGVISTTDVGTCLPAWLTARRSPVTCCWTPASAGSAATSVPSPAKQFYHEVVVEKKIHNKVVSVPSRTEWKPHSLLIWSRIKLQSMMSSVKKWKKKSKYAHVLLYHCDYYCYAHFLWQKRWQAHWLPQRKLNWHQNYKVLIVEVMNTNILLQKLCDATVNKTSYFAAGVLSKENNGFTEQYMSKITLPS